MALAVVVFFLTIAATLWIWGDMSYLSKPILKQFAFTMALISFMTWGFLTFFYEMVFHYKSYTSYYFLALIPFFLFGIYYLKKARKVVPLSVQANQQRYWDEIKGSDIYAFFAGRKKRKRKKIVIRVNEQEKKFFKTSESMPDKDYVSVGFFKTLKRIESEFSFVKAPSNDKKAIEKAMNDTINKIPLYKVVFDKIKYFIKEQDIDVDFVEILKEDKYCVEFFLLDLWERYTKRVNIGTANLVLLAEREIEEEFIGAMDNIDLYSVKGKGAALYYRYMVFMQRVENYLKEPKKDEKAQLEELDREFKDGDFL